MPTLIPPTEYEVCGAGNIPNKGVSREVFRAWIKAYHNLFGTAGTTDGALTTLGATTTGKALFVAADASAGRTALGVSASGATVFTGTSVAGRIAIDALIPAFSATRITNQSITSSVFTKVQCATEEFDYTGCYDNATNYRFQPNVAGLYSLQFAAGCNASTAPTRILSSIYKNGVEFKRGSDNTFANVTQSIGTALSQMNGTTDYIEFYCYITATTAVIDGSANLTYFQASLTKAG